MFSSICSRNSGRAGHLFFGCFILLASLFLLWLFGVATQRFSLVDILLVAVMNKIDFVLVKLNGKNYVGWSFHLENCVEGPGLAGYLDGFVLAPSAVKYKAPRLQKPLV